MISVFLTKIKTVDGVTLNGIVLNPKGKRGVALIWVHGLCSSFHSGQTLIKELSTWAIKNRIGYLKFDTRGAYVVQKSGFGCGFEKFEDSIYDIRAMVRFARSLGYKKIVLAGHSTGANKVLYYVYKTRDRAVRGLILLGPVSDIEGEIKKIGKRELQRRLAIARRLKKNPKALMPGACGFISARRYWSLFHAGEKEDTFPYHNPRGRWKALNAVALPLFVVIGSRDAYLDRSAKKFIHAFQKNAVSTKSFSAAIIPGAGHSFVKKERPLSRAIVRWIQQRVVR